MALIQQIDPIYVDLNQTSVEGLQLRQQMTSGELSLTGANRPQVRLVLEDGSAYSQVGSLEFTDISVDPGTGSVMLRAIFPNPDHVLLPGMFVRAVVDRGTNDRAILPKMGSRTIAPAARPRSSWGRTIRSLSARSPPRVAEVWPAV